MTTKRASLSVLIIGSKKSKASQLLLSAKYPNHHVTFYTSSNKEAALNYLANHKIDIIVMSGQSKKKTSILAEQDFLTGSLSRKTLIEQLAHSVAYAKRYKTTCAVLYIDLDGFKPINDLLGRQYGDELLKKVAERIHSVIRKADLFSRVGGDEFVVILTHIEHEVDAGRAATKINDALMSPFELNHQHYYLTSSIGIALYPNDHAEPETLVQYADMAMSIVKRKGKNNYQYYKAELNQAAEKNIRMANDLRVAIENKQLLLHFQPLVDAKKNTISGIEALLRWNHPEFGMVSPSDFIPLAEETGLITTLSEWVLKTACQHCVNWEKLGLKEFYISVNFSVKDFQQENYIDKVKKCFLKEKANPKRFVFEVTETVFADNQTEVLAKILLLKELGVRIAMDDFGTGYSSLSYLKNLPIDIMKIDRSFVQAIENKKKSRHNEMVAVIIELAKRLEIKTLAEGIETTSQADFLKTAGCEYFQGYLFSKPVPHDIITQYLKHKKIAL